MIRTTFFKKKNKDIFLNNEKNRFEIYKFRTIFEKETQSSGEIERV